MTIGLLHYIDTHILKNTTDVFLSLLTCICLEVWCEALAREVRTCRRSPLPTSSMFRWSACGWKYVYRFQLKSWMWILNQRWKCTPSSYVHAAVFFLTNCKLAAMFCSSGSSDKQQYVHIFTVFILWLQEHLQSRHCFADSCELEQMMVWQCVLDRTRLVCHTYSTLRVWRACRLHSKFAKLFQQKFSKTATRKI